MQINSDFLGHRIIDGNICNQGIHTVRIYDGLGNTIPLKT